MGGLSDTPAGWRSYGDYLAWQATDGPAGRNKAYVRLSAGWALGTAEFKAALRADHALAEEARAWTKEGSREIKLARWAKLLASGLKAVGQNQEQAAEAPKSAPWKLAVAAWLKSRTQVGNAWLSEQLYLGAPAAFSRNLTLYKRQLDPKDKLWKALTSISAA